MENFFEIYPVNFDKRDFDEVRRSEEQRILAEKNQVLDQKYSQKYGVLDEFCQKLSEGEESEVRKIVEISKAKEGQRANQEARVEAKLLLNRKGLEDVLRMVDSTEVTPIQISRDISYYGEMIPMSLGSGEEHWMGSQFYSFFEQAQEFMIGDQKFRLAVMGDIYIQKDIPLLRVNRIIGSHPLERRDRGWYRHKGIYNGHEQLDFGLKTQVEANDFCYAENSGTRLENFDLQDNDPNKLITEQVAGIIRFINAPLGKVPSVKSKESLVRYDGTTGEPVLVPRDYLKKKD